MIRSTVDGAVLVWSVPNTRWPVSAVSMAMAMVSRSRSSPTRTTSGSSRSAARSAALKDRGVRPHLALVHQAALVVVHELDRVLDGDDVVVPVAVHVVDQGGERGRLARAGGAGDEHEPLREEAQVEDRLREPHVRGREDLGGDLAHHRADAVSVGEDVDAEAGLGGGVGEVGVGAFLELLRGSWRARWSRACPMSRPASRGPSSGSGRDVAVDAQRRRVPPT